MDRSKVVRRSIPFFASGKWGIRRKGESQPFGASNTAVLAGFVLFKGCYILRNKEQNWRFLPQIKNILLHFCMWHNLPQAWKSPFITKKVQKIYKIAKQLASKLTRDKSGLKGSLRRQKNWYHVAFIRHPGLVLDGFCQKKNNFCSLKNLKNTFYLGLFFKEL